ncbi:hypothetical protein HZA99_01135 [Candidatus Woesearchaeota archaeon]|nr:hypothetical protein [Candidatus Woesearchaeota archaeon]
MKRQEVIFLSTGAIGDMVIASALHAPFYERDISMGIVSAEFTRGLWQHFGNTITYAYGKDKVLPEFPTDAVVVDIRNYLRHLPHSQNLPQWLTKQEEKRKGHLCEWMAYEAATACPGIERILKETFKVTRDDVQIILTEEEIEEGKARINEIRKESNNKLVTILAPYSNTENRNMGMRQLEEVVVGLQDTTTVCQLEPFQPADYVVGTKPVGDRDLRKVAALLLAADAYIGVDSGPLHIINGAIQGTGWYSHKLDGKRDPAKVFVVLGSSHPDVVAYEGNTIITALTSHAVCPVAPCGAHGYVAPEEYGKYFGEIFHPSRKEGDKSGCIYQEHDFPNTAPCMSAVSSEQIVEAVQAYLRDRK